MKLRTMAVLLAGVTLATGAEKKTPTPKPKPKIENKAKIPESLGVEDAIPAPVKALGEPAMMTFPNGIRMAVSAATEEAQAHVNQGLNHLHGGWEFEASRHFAAAMREDPECLLAHWGMVMCLLTPSPETGAARNVATDRLLDLVDQGKGTELERGYAYGLIKYIEEGPKGAAIAFHKIAGQFPNDMQAGIFAALFGRGGYDDFGTATPDQEVAEKSLLAMIEKNPESPLPLNALLTIRGEAPDLRDSLDLARKLCELAPDYAPYFHVLGHYEWRSGRHARAAVAFSKASSLFSNWMKENKASIADCPEWVKAECYGIVSQTSRGDFEKAYAAARVVAATPTPADRIASPGVRLLLWDAKTLPARILLRRNLRGNANEALQSLPVTAEIKNTQTKSLAYLWIDGLRLALDAQRLIEDGKLSEAQLVIEALTLHGEAFSKTQTAASNSGERSHWNRAFRAMEVLASELRGRMAMAGPKDRLDRSYNWFASATDRQTHSLMMFAPMILTPMASRLGEYYMATDRPTEAIESYERALTSFPNDISALKGIKEAYEKAKLPDKAAATEKQIETLQAE